MEYVIRLAEAPTDLASLEHYLLDLDPAAIIDVAPTTGALRCSTSATAAELLHAFADAGYLVMPHAIERVPSVCCGGCSG
ncbi:MAG: hypothetical protein GXC75_14890 [Xanthomonadaceae bacterium]|nr:hypothetical protein [Xanthomonadaceae bacterium]